MEGNNEGEPPIETGRIDFFSDPLDFRISVRMNRCSAYSSDHNSLLDIAHYSVCQNPKLEVVDRLERIFISNGSYEVIARDSRSFIGESSGKQSIEYVKYLLRDFAKRFDSELNYSGRINDFIYGDTLFKGKFEDDDENFETNVDDD